FLWPKEGFQRPRRRRLPGRVRAEDEVYPRSEAAQLVALRDPQQPIDPEPPEDQPHHGFSAFWRRSSSRRIAAARRSSCSATRSNSARSSAPPATSTNAREPCTSATSLL